MTRRHARTERLLLLALTCLLSWVACGPARAADATAHGHVGKLQVTQAFYGDLPDGAKADVTDKLKQMVTENRLWVEANNDNFGDPAEGIVKKLTVEYTIDDVAHSRTVSEGETLRISGNPSKIVIRKALYGQLPDGPKVDVTEKVAERVDGDSLMIQASNVNFGDPAEGVTKQLTVEYTRSGVPHVKTVIENQTLLISDKPPRLVIVKAVYGDLPDGAKSDVTAKVAEQVSGDSLTIQASNDNFADPAEGITKKLRVDYTFDAQEHSKTVEENQTLTISDKGE